MTATVGSFESMNWKAQLLYKIGYISSEAIDTLYTDVADRFPAFRDKFQVSPCSFTDYSRFRPAQEKRNYIVFAGRLEAYKNPYLFVDAVALCAERLRHDGWKCYLYGKGEFEQGIAARVDELNLGDLIELGATADLSPLLGESKVFISIQQTENYPSQVLLEAMAAENAIVATDVGETRRLVDEEVGTLFAEQTPERLADAIEELIQDSDLCRTRGRKARERVVGSHNVASYSKYMEQLWLGVVERHPTHIHTSSASIARLILGSLVGELLRRVTGR
jgi:glycosyltransferase involved in cell wall biosynthesis